MKNKNGITLIGLVITIIVLLILAGVSISLITGENGIINKVQDAKNKTKDASELELIYMAIAEAKMNSTGEFEEDVFKESLDGYFSDTGYNLNGSQEDGWELNINGELYEINDSKVEKVSEIPELIEPEDINDWDYIPGEKENTVILTKYKGLDTKVKIPNSINGDRVIQIGDGINWFWDTSIATRYQYSSSVFYYQETITEIIIPDGIECIANAAFRSSKLLEKVEIPDSITIIGTNAFADCSLLTEIDIPDNIVSLGDSAFCGTKISEIVFPDGIEIIPNGICDNCKSLTKIILPESVVEIGRFSFGNCTSLKNIYLPDNLEIIGFSAFSNCTLLQNVIIPESVTTMGNAVFYNITNLTVRVPFVETAVPDGWSTTWNKLDYNNNLINVSYAE